MRTMNMQLIAFFCSLFVSFLLRLDEIVVLWMDRSHAAFSRVSVAEENVRGDGKDFECVDKFTFNCRMCSYVERRCVTDSQME